MAREKLTQKGSKGGLLPAPARTSQKPAASRRSMSFGLLSQNLKANGYGGGAGEDDAGSNEDSGSASGNEKADDSATEKRKKDRGKNRLLAVMSENISSQYIKSGGTSHNITSQKLQNKLLSGANLTAKEITLVQLEYMPVKLKTDPFEKAIIKIQKKLQKQDEKEQEQQKEFQKAKQNIISSNIRQKLLRKTLISEKYIVSYKNKNKQKWDIFILCLAFQNSLIIPIDLAFAPDFTKIKSFEVFDNIVDGLFLIDMIVMFMTSFINKKGAEVLDSHQIASKYMMSFRFVADFFAVLGTGIVTQYLPALKAFGIFKMVRIMRLGGIIARLNVPEDMKALLNLIKFTFYLWLLVHVLGCSWYMAISINKDNYDEEGRSKRWYSPTDWMNASAANMFETDYEWGWGHQYLISLYHAVLMLGSNEIGPVNTEEMAFCVAGLIMTSLINAQIFGEMAVLITVMQKKKTNYQEKLDAANNAMAKIGIPQLLQEDVHDFLHKTQNTRDFQEETDKFFDLISPRLKVSVQQKIFESNLRKNPIIQTMIGHSEQVKKTPQRFIVELFSKLFNIGSAKHPQENEYEVNQRELRGGEGKPRLLESRKTGNEEFLKMLVSKLGTCFATPEEEVISQDMLGDDMYFLSKGDCAINITDEQGKEYVAVRLLTEGDYFGEIAMIYKCKRTATVVSRNYNTMARITYDRYREVTNEYPEFQRLLKDHLYKYNDKKKEFLQSLVKKVYYFNKDLDQETLHDLMHKMVPKKYDAGHVIVKEVTVASSMFFVVSGVVESYTTMEGNEFVLDRLYSGSVINYRSFFLEDINCISYRAKENCQLLELSLQTIYKIMEEDDKFKKEMLIFQDVILQKNKKYPLDYIVNIPDIQKDRRISNDAHEQILKRRNTLKNMVFRRLLEIREINKKPKLGQLLAMFKNNSDPDAKDQLIAKLTKLYKQQDKNDQGQQDIKYERIMTSFDRLQKSFQIQHDALDVMDRKMNKLIERRIEREQHGIDIKAMFREIITEKMKGAQVIGRIKNKQIDKNRMIAIQNAKAGFNPFLKLLKKIRANNSANLALLQEDMIDEDFEKHKEQDVLIKNPIDQFNKSNYFKNDIDEQTKCFDKLTKIAGKPETEGELEPFVSPMLKMDLSIYKRKKRKQLLRQMNRNGKNEASQESLSIEGASVDNDEDESDDSSDEEQPTNKKPDLKGQKTKLFSEMSQINGESGEESKRSSNSTREFEAAYQSHKLNIARRGSASGNSRKSGASQNNLSVAASAPKLRPGKTVLFLDNDKSEASVSDSSRSETSTSRQLVAN